MIILDTVQNVPNRGRKRLQIVKFVLIHTNAIIGSRFTGVPRQPSGFRLCKESNAEYHIEVVGQV